MAVFVIGWLCSTGESLKGGEGVGKKYKLDGVYVNILLGDKQANGLA
jgi:hypothetical protein